MGDVLIKPKAADPSTDHEEPKVAHIVKKDDQMRGYVMGETIVALCGQKLVPSRDPNRYPICENCKDVIRKQRQSGSN